MTTKRLSQSKCVTKPIFLDGLYFIGNKKYFKDTKQNKKSVGPKFKKMYHSIQWAFKIKKQKPKQVRLIYTNYNKTQCLQ